MNAEEYINQLKEQLKDFTPEETSMFVEEIRAHIEEGLEDPHLGPVEQRSQKLEAEMGSPNDMSRNFKEIYRPNRWIDFLLVFVPFEILKYPILLLSTILLARDSESTGPFFTAPDLMVSIRVTILLYMLLVFIALRRKSMGLLFFWLPQLILSTYVLVYREKRLLLNGFFHNSPSGIMESVFWVVLLSSLVGYLGYWIWRQRRDAQLVVLALLPFLFTLGSMLVNPYSARGLFSGGYQLPQWNITVLGGFPLGLYQISMLIWPVLFYLFRQRSVRWLGLLVNAVPLAVMNLVASRQFPLLAAVWAIPMVLVLAAWYSDLGKQQSRPHIAT